MYDKPLDVRGMIPSFQLQAINRSSIVSPWDYKQRYSLVIFLFHDVTCKDCRELLLNLSQQYPAYRTVETEVLAIATGYQSDEVESLRTFVEQSIIPFPVLWDEQGQVSHVYLGKTDRTQVGVFVCDRFGELYMKSVADEADELLSEAEIRSWAEFVDMQCPECFPPIWR